MTKIVIKVKGGLVQSVHSSSADVQVVLIDYDNIEQGDAMTDAQLTASEEISDKKLLPVL